MRLLTLLSIAFVAVAFGGCAAATPAGTGVAPGSSSPSDPPGTPAPATATPPSTPPATPPATATPSASPGPTLFSSPAYRYDATFPPDLVPGDVVPASEPWDGTAQIGSDGPRTDHVPVDGSRLLFVYGAPTDLALADWAAAGQQQKAAWHGCPPVPDAQVDVSVDDAPGLLYDFACGGLHLLSVYTVHDGFGLVVNLMSPPGDPATDRAAMDTLLAGMRWQP